ncbi:MAG TPA: VOC family protein [Alphaproteobacteria bacterium]|nr:VOC family protein [Alphaproteobacteria bacterium]
MIPFHLAFPIRDIEETRRFYRDVLGCTVGREAPRWIDFDFFGHQLSAHVRPEELGAVRTNELDGDAVPVRHFGAVLPWAEWEALAGRIRAAGLGFLIEPHVRFQGQPGEQGTFFVNDPAGNALEFKTFRDPKQMFA